MKKYYLWIIIAAVVIFALWKSGLLYAGGIVKDEPIITGRPTFTPPPINF